MNQVVEGGITAKILVTDKQRDAIMDAIASALGSSAYDCDRVWSAWSVGTMGEDDFAAIAQNDERIQEIADAAIGALQQYRYAPPADGADGPSIEQHSTPPIDGKIEGYEYGSMWAGHAVRPEYLQQQPTPPAEGEAGELAAELRHFLAGYQQMRGLDPEYIYSIHRGDAMEAHLRVSRLTRAADLLESQSLQPVGAITAAEAERLAHEAGFSAVDSDENELRQTFVVWEATTAQLTAVVNAAIAFDRAKFLPPPAEEDVSNDAWKEFVAEIAKAQAIATREGECPPFDLVKMARALWREALALGSRTGGAIMSWQPIETAPKDQLIMLWRPDAHEWARRDIGKWDDDEYEKKPEPYWRSFFLNVFRSEMRNWRPTHWQPLPQPPTQPINQEVSDGSS